MINNEKVQNSNFAGKKYKKDMTGVIISCLLIGGLFIGTIVLAIFTGIRLNLL